VYPVVSYCTDKKQAYCTASIDNAGKKLAEGIEKQRFKLWYNFPDKLQSYSWARWQNGVKRLLASSWLSVCPSVRKEQLGSHCTDFHEIWHSSTFRKSVEKIQVSLKSAKNNGTLNEDHYSLLIISRWIILRMRKFSDKFVEKIKTHPLRSVTFVTKIAPFVR
jgi:hypothetical protein